MAGQGVERREILRMLAVASAIGTCPGFARWSYAFGDAAADPSGLAASQAGHVDYAPRFFTAEEYRLLRVLASRIIPADDTPGAEEAGVSEFIDTMVAHDRALQPRFRSGLAWVDARTRLLHGRAFEALPEAEQVAFLERLAYAAKHQPGEDEGRRFFALVREYTVMGYYTSRVGLEALGYPGLTMYGESPACPDPDDVTHRHRRIVARLEEGRAR
jgi:gluconate 2-dehydrogenase gamma chain